MATSSCTLTRDVSPDMFEDSNLTTNEEEGGCTWRGSSMSEIYNNKGPFDWNPEPIHPSIDHKVLFNMPLPEKGPPNPRFTSESYCWNPDYVRMPFAKQNLYPVSNGGTSVLKNRWTLITEALSQPIYSSNDLQQRIFAYNNKYEDRWQFHTLHHFFNNVLDEDENEYFFENIMPNIVKLALQLPELLPSSIPLLKKKRTQTISLTQLQIASLLANAFLCTFPRRNTNKPQSEFGSYPLINFNRFFQATEKRVHSNCNKLQCIINYFRRVSTNPPDGVVTFQRRYLNEFELPQWRKADQPLSSLRIHIENKGTIEDGLGLLQVDFANKYIGGGVLGSGCVQEEIRFAVCPELIVSCLFTEELEPTEALIITGVEQYNSWTGYGDTFTWTGDYKDTTPRDMFRRRKCYLVAIDATRFTQPNDQYNISRILRELNKAYVGYYSPTQNKPIPAVATGNWGCGAFRGDPYLKSLLQIMACRLAGRDIVYYTFGNASLCDELYSLFKTLTENNITIGNIYNYFIQFSESKLPGRSLYPFLLRKITNSDTPLDTKSITISKKRRKINSPPKEPKIKTMNGAKNIIVDEIFDSVILNSESSSSQISSKLHTEDGNIEMNCNLISSSNEDSILLNKMKELEKQNVNLIITSNVSSSSSSIGDSILLAKLQEMEKNEMMDASSSSKKISVCDTDKMDVDTKFEEGSNKNSTKIKRKISDYFKK